MKTIKSYATETQIINKSEFISEVFPVNNKDDVQKELTNVRKKYYDATHHCYSYILGKSGEEQKASDDGEPQATAGAPIVQMLVSYL